MASVQYNHSVVSNYLRPHGLQHARLPCPSPTPRACTTSCPLSRWCHPTTSSSVLPFSYLQSFPASGFFPMSQLFASGNQSGASASASVLPMNIHNWFPLGCTGCISLQPKGSSRVFSKKKKKESSPMTQFKIIGSLALSFLYGPTLTSIHDYWKNRSFDFVDLCRQSKWYGLGAQYLLSDNRTLTYIFIDWFILSLNIISSHGTEVSHLTMQPPCPSPLPGGEKLF